MLRFAADENFSGAIVAGVLRRNSRVDVVRLQDVGLDGTPDPQVLEWCANENRILLSHDVSTVTAYAHERVRAGLRMPGVFQVSYGSAIGRCIEDLLLIAEASGEDDWENQVIFLPL